MSFGSINASVSCALPFIHLYFFSLFFVETCSIAMVLIYHHSKTFPDFLICVGHLHLKNLTSISHLMSSKWKSFFPYRSSFSYVPFSSLSHKSSESLLLLSSPLCPKAIIVKSYQFYPCNTNVISSSRYSFSKAAQQIMPKFSSLKQHIYYFTHFLRIRNLGVA